MITREELELYRQRFIALRDEDPLEIFYMDYLRDLAEKDYPRLINELLNRLEECIDNSTKEENTND